MLVLHTMSSITVEYTWSSGIKTIQRGLYKYNTKYGNNSTLSSVFNSKILYIEDNSLKYIDASFDEHIVFENYLDHLDEIDNFLTCIMKITFSYNLCEFVITCLEIDMKFNILNSDIMLSYYFDNCRKIEITTNNIDSFIQYDKLMEKIESIGNDELPDIKIDELCKISNTPGRNCIPCEINKIDEFYMYLDYIRDAFKKTTNLQKAYEYIIKAKNKKVKRVN